MNPRAATRAGHADRQLVVHRLWVAHQHGQLSRAEYDRRSRYAQVARTYADLDQLVADLSSPGRPTSGRAARSRSRRGLLLLWTAYLAVCAVMWYLIRQPDATLTTTGPGTGKQNVALLLGIVGVMLAVYTLLRRRKRGNNDSGGDNVSDDRSGDGSGDHGGHDGGGGDGGGGGD